MSINFDFLEERPYFYYTSQIKTQYNETLEFLQKFKRNISIGKERAQYSFEDCSVIVNKLSHFFFKLNMKSLAKQFQKLEKSIVKDVIKIDTKKENLGLPINLLFKEIGISNNYKNLLENLNNEIIEKNEIITDFIEYFDYLATFVNDTESIVTKGLTRCEIYEKKFMNLTVGLTLLKNKNDKIIDEENNTHDENTLQ